jgi:hypothetical protein
MDIVATVICSQCGWDYGERRYDSHHQDITFSCDRCGRWTRTGPDGKTVELAGVGVICLRGKDGGMIQALNQGDLEKAKGRYERAVANGWADPRISYLTRVDAKGKPHAVCGRLPKCPWGYLRSLRREGEKRKQ